MSKVIRLVIASLILAGTVSTATLATADPVPLCYPGQPNCRPWTTLTANLK